MNYVSVRVSNKYDKSFSISHNLKSKHKTLDKKLKRYCKDNNLDFNDLDTFAKYQIIRSQNTENYIINNDGTKTIFRRDLSQELSLLELLEKTPEIEKLIKETKADYKKYNSYYNKTNKIFKDKIKEIEEDYKKHRKRKLRTDRTINYGGIITFGNDTEDLSREEMNNQDQDKLDAKRELTVKKVMKSLNIKDNEFYLVKHIDEYQIHYHFEFIGYNYKEHKLVRRELTQQKMIEFQDLAGERFNDLDFHRGKAKDSRVRDYCEEHNINYEDLSVKEKYNILKEVGVKYESLKEYNKRLNNDTYKKEQSRVKLELQIQDIYKKIVNRDFTLEQIDQLKEQNTNKLIKQMLNDAYRFLNLKNDEQSQLKALDRLNKKYAKADGKLKEITFEIEGITEVINEYDEIITKLNKVVQNQQNLLNSNVKINVSSKSNNISVNKINVVQTQDKIKQIEIDKSQEIEKYKSQLENTAFKTNEYNIEILKEMEKIEELHKKHELWEKLEKEEVKVTYQKKDIKSKSRSSAEKTKEKLNDLDKYINRFKPDYQQPEPDLAQTTDNDRDWD